MRRNKGRVEMLSKRDRVTLVIVVGAATLITLVLLGTVLASGFNRIDRSLGRIEAQVSEIEIQVGELESSVEELEAAVSQPAPSSSPTPAPASAREYRYENVPVPALACLRDGRFPGAVLCYPVVRWVPVRVPR